MGSTPYPPAAGGPSPAHYALNPALITTALELPGVRIVRSLVFGSIGASFQTLVGGDITLYTSLCEKTREDAFTRMAQHAAEHGANAIISFRYDANELMPGVTEVLAYGTAVYVEQI